ncbi:MAG: hypothetical protein SFU85_08215 [Candidatus Methylacidiphilales bacterium]|nr:hypothetical protein [Candidatus Methylacidiphilales bacterium]
MMFVRRWTIRLVILAAVSGILIWGGKQTYQAIRLWHHRQIAVDHTRKGDYTQAAFFARLVLQASPKDDEALRLMGELAQRNGYPVQAVEWYGRRAEFHPGQPAVLLDFAQSLLAAGQPGPAGKVLDLAAGRPGVDKERLEQLRANRAIALHDFPAAVRIYRNLLATRPGQALMTYNLANILSISPLEKERAEGESLLRQLWLEKKMPLEVSRSLVAMALRDKVVDQTGPWLDCLQKDPAAQWSDLLLAGEALGRTPGGIPPEWFQNLTRKCRSDLDIYRALDWFRKTGRQTVALDWWGGLPPASRDLPLVLVGRAEVLTDLGQWDRLADELEGQNWQPLEHFRFAFLVQARSLGRETLVREERSPAERLIVSSLLRRPTDFFRLDDLLRHWNWSATRREEILAGFASQFPDDRPMLMALIKEAQQRRDTLALFHLGGRILALEPDNPVARNNVAFYGLLLEREVGRSTALAEALVRDLPDLKEARMTLAYSRFCAGRTDEALALVRTLSQEDLSRPSSALYAGLILQKAGKSSEALRYFDLARQHREALPEETVLLQRALKEAGGSPDPSH